MAKIGRNAQCPCGSGKKFKHCCALIEQESRPQLSAEQAMKVTLMSAVNQSQQDALERKQISRELGVFFFYSTVAGDAWLLEMTECDCVQIAQAGEALEAPIDENSETIEINWSHTFALVSKQLVITAYEDQAVTTLEKAPVTRLRGAMKRLRKKLSKEQLKQVHLPHSDQTAA